MDSIESTILSVSMNPDSPPEQQQQQQQQPVPSSSPTPVQPVQSYQQAPSLTPPVSTPSNETDVPMSGPEEEPVPQMEGPPPVLVESVLMEDQSMTAEEPVPAAVTLTDPIPAPVPEVACETVGTEAVETEPNAPVAELNQTEQPLPTEVTEAITETPSGKRPRAKKPKSASKAKSKAKKEADTWVDGEALSSAGADTNDEVCSLTFTQHCRLT